MQTQNLNVKISGISIKQIEVVKYLGILIDENLTWDAHINHVINKLLKFCSIFYKIRNLIPPSIMKKVYFALIHSHLVYGIELYANTFAKYLDPLIKLNNKILRIIQFKPFRTPTKQLYSEFNTLPIPDLHKYHVLLLMHRFEHYKSSLPIHFRDLIRLNRDVHNIQTRQSNLYHMKGARTKFGHMTITYLGPALWNGLPYLLKINRGIHN